MFKRDNKDIKPKKTQDKFSRLEEEAIEDIQQASTDKPATTADSRFIGAAVSKVFADLAEPVTGNVIAHVPGKAEDGDGEQWIVQYGTKRESVDPQELLEILVGEEEAAAKKKADADAKKAQTKQKKAEKEAQTKKKKQDKLYNDPLIGRKVQEYIQFSDDPNDEQLVTGTVIKATIKTSGKGKGKVQYEIRYDDDSLNLPNIKVSALEVKKMLI